MTPLDVLAVAPFGAIGLALGLAHFAGLRRDAGRYLARGVRAGIVAGHAARLVASAAVLVLVARSGAVPLLAALAGFLVARFVAVALTRRSP
jgi:N-ATPase, AtpR subunit